MLVQQKYERVKYNPSAPVLDIIVRPRPASSQQTGETIRVLVDSGADATMIPEALLVNIGAAKD